MEGTEQGRFGTFDGLEQLLCLFILHAPIRGVFIAMCMECFLKEGQRELLILGRSAALGVVSDTSSRCCKHFSRR